MFVELLITGLEQGFNIGITVLPTSTLECRNLLSARNQPEIVDRLLEYEIEKGYLDGLYDVPPYTIFRISPIGISQGKYSKKHRLNVDLSSPPNQSSEKSINNLIDKDEYSLQYVRIYDAISILKTLLMCKTNIVDAFK